VLVCACVGGGVGVCGGGDSHGGVIRGRDERISGRISGRLAWICLI
jgi:hypothetical protein